VAKETLNRGWQRNFHRLAGMHWDIRHAAGILPNETRSQLAPLWNYTFTLPQSQLQRSLVYIGPNHRLRRVLLGLQQGQLTKVGVIGGSISHGASASKIGQTDWFSLVGEFLVNSYPQAQVGCGCAAVDSLQSVAGLIQLMHSTNSQQQLAARHIPQPLNSDCIKFLIRRFPKYHPSTAAYPFELQQPQQLEANSRAETVDDFVSVVLQVQLRNGCLPATPSALMEMCLEQSVDSDVDLLFIEYVANDGANRCGSAFLKRAHCRTFIQQWRQLLSSSRMYAFGLESINSAAVLHMLAVSTFRVSSGGDFCLCCPAAGDTCGGAGLMRQRPRCMSGCCARRCSSPRGPQCCWCRCGTTAACTTHLCRPSSNAGCQTMMQLYSIAAAQHQQQVAAGS
jgi:hypothetical protein